MLVYRGWRKSKPWRLTYRDPIAKRNRVKGFATEAEAAAFEAVQAELAAHELELLKRARHKARRTAAADAALTVNDLLNAFLARPGIRDNTRAGDTYHAVPVRRLLGQRRAASLTVEDVTAFTEAQQKRNIMQTTINRRVKVLRAACNWAVGKGMLKSSPLAALRLPHARSRRITPPTMAELRRILPVAAEHVRRVIWLEMGAGARPGPSELFRLPWGLVDLDAGGVLMPCAAKRHSGTDYRALPLRGDLHAEMRQWREADGDCPWVIHYHGRQVRNIGAAWRNALRRAGITRRIRLYDLRHAFPTEAIRAGADIRSMAEIMDHSDPSMLLKVYQHVSDGQLRAAVEAPPSLATG